MSSGTVVKKEINIFTIVEIKQKKSTQIFISPWQIFLKDHFKTLNYIKGLL